MIEYSWSAHSSLVIHVSAGTAAAFHRNYRRWLVVEKGGGGVGCAVEEDGGYCGKLSASAV